LKNKNLLVALPYALGFLIAAPKLTSFGMFVDGVLYASIARNMAEGLGGFWSAHYTSVIYPQFFEHPPLAIWFLSLFYRLFGDSRYVESFYSLCAWLIVFFLMSKIWVCFHWRQARWVPAVLLLFAPITSWILTYNELEGPLQVTCLLSVLFVVEAMWAESAVKRFFYAMASGIMIVFAFLVKGPFGLYPLAAPILIYFTCLNTTTFRLIQVYFIQISICVVAALMIYIYPESNHFFSQYFHIQLKLSLAGQREINNPHFYILLKVLGDAAVMLALALILSYSANRKIKKEKSGPFLFFMFMGLVTSLPLVISPKNMSWYLMLSMPYFALAIASYFRPAMIELEDKVLARWNKWLKGFLLLILVAGVSICVISDGKPRRSREYYRSFVAQPLIGIESELVSVCPGELHKNWSLVANLMRDYKISLTDVSGQRYLIVEAGRGCEAPERCEPYRTGQEGKFSVFECR